MLTNDNKYFPLRPTNRALDHSWTTLLLIIFGGFKTVTKQCVIFYIAYNPIQSDSIRNRIQSEIQSGRLNLGDCLQL